MASFRKPIGRVYDSPDNSPRWTSLDEDLKKIPRQFENLSLNTFKELIQSEKDRLTVEMILEIYEYIRYTTGYVPTTLDPEDMLSLMNLLTEDEIKKDLKELCLIELRRIKANQDESTDENSLLVTPLQSDMFCQRPVRRLLEAAFFGQPLVIDFGFEDHLMDIEIYRMARSVSLAIESNQNAKYPYQLYFCNYRKGSETDKKLLKFFPNLHKSSSFVIKTSKSYLNLFPKEKLVYLTSDSPVELTKYCHDSVYIVGAIYNLPDAPKNRLAFDKAKSQALPAFRLPLESYSVNLNNDDFSIRRLLPILNSCKINHSDWTLAFKEIPAYKLTTVERFTFLKKPFFKRGRQSLFNEHDL